MPALDNRPLGVCGDMRLNLPAYKLFPAFKPCLLHLRLCYHCLFGFIARCQGEQGKDYQRNQGSRLNIDHDYCSEKNNGHLVELEARIKNGSLVTAEMFLSAVKMEGKWHATPFIKDISKRVTSEKERDNLLDQLRQSQKMEAVGTMAGGIAHDFNNILTPILGFAQLLQIQFEEGSKERDRVEKILSSANRAKDLVGQILSFSRKSKEEKQPTLVVPVVRESLKLLRAGIPATINIKARIPISDF